MDAQQNVILLGASQLTRTLLLTMEGFKVQPPVKMLGLLATVAAFSVHNFILQAENKQEMLKFIKKQLVVLAQSIEEEYNKNVNNTRV